MINIYIKSGLIRKQPIVAFILQHDKYRWLKTNIIHYKLTLKEIESLSILIALKHIQDKYICKPINIYVDSEYLLSMLKRDNNNEYIQLNSSVNISKHLREIILDLNVNIYSIDHTSDNYQELNHVYQECGLDHIELNEKETL